MSLRPLRVVALAAAALALTAAGCRTTAPPEAAPAPPVASTPMPDAPLPGGPPPTTSPADGSAGRVAGPGVGDPLSVTLAETARRDGHAIQFLSVVEDSRCPADVTCVWEGRARVALAINGTSVTLTVPYASQRDDEPSMIELGMIAVEVVGLDPYPGTPGAAGQTPTLRLVTRHAGI